MDVLSRIKSVEELELEGRRVFMRVDLNCPVDDDGLITDDARITAALPTIQFARQRGARLVLCSHLGRPKGRPRKELSLLAVGERLAELLRSEVLLPDDCIGDGPKKLIQNLREGQVVLLENVRFHKGEAKNDDTFARALAALGQSYVSDAFGCTHRPHASVVGVPKVLNDRAAGLQFLKEVRALQRVFTPDRPFVLVVGGAKIASRIGVIENLLGACESVLIGGAMAYTFLSALGVDVGSSPVEHDKIAHVKRVLLKAEAKGVRLVLPSDHMTAEGRVVQNGRLQPSDTAIDLGPESTAEFTTLIRGARSVLWTGPMGVYEQPLGANGTEQVAAAVAQVTESVVVGGETAVALRRAGLVPFVRHVSSGGGAALELLEGKELPGLEALRQNRRGSDGP